MVGFLALIFGFFGFGIWAAMAPIEGAVLAPGTFVATGQNKKIQHLEGGVISQILVREGDIVERGQPLIKLDEVEQRAALRRLTLRRDQLLATGARLVAEAEGRMEASYPVELTRRARDPEVAAIIASQSADLRARQNRLVSEIAVVERGMSALREAIGGHKVKRESVDAQLAIIDEELSAKGQLLAKGLVRKPEFLALKRIAASLKGDIGQLTSEVAEGEERVTRGMEQIEQLRTASVQTATEKLQEVRSEFTDVEERIRAAQNVLERIEILSPVRGIVIKLMYHTIGGVITPGAAVLELVPVDDELIIEARVMPKDIDSLESGQDAVIRLSTLNQRITPMVKGKVIYVSADTVQDNPNAMQSKSVYIARVALEQSDIHKLQGFRSTPGMPAEVFIKTGERTFLQYLLQPLIDRAARAFREV
jgi:HlyD family secretion protein